MISKGHKLLIACLRDSEVSIFSRVNEKWFVKDELRGYKEVKDLLDKSGRLLNVKTYCDKFKFKLEDVPESAAYYFRVVSEEYGINELNDKVDSILKDFKKEGFDVTAEKLIKLVESVKSPTAFDDELHYNENPDSVLADYDRRENCGGIEYLSMGNDLLDKVFHGYRKFDLITIGGRAGMGKSWYICYLALLLDMKLRGRNDVSNILFITNEMGAEEVRERLICIEYKIPYDNFLAGNLTGIQRRRLNKAMEDFGENNTKIHIVPNCNTMSALQEKIIQHKPSAVFIDGSYLLETRMQEGWEKITYITRNLKLYAKQFGTPIINTTQMKRGTGKAVSKMSFDGQDDFAYSNSYVQDSDIALRMFQNPEMVGYNIIGIDIAKARRAKTTTVFSFQSNIDTMELSITEDVGYSEERSGKDSEESSAHKLIPIASL